MLEDKDALAGSAVGPAPVQMPEEPREVFPVRFDKDYLDFRGTPKDDELVPKASSAPVSAGTQKSPTGLEDVSEDDLVTNALNSAGRATTQAPESGS